MSDFEKYLKQNKHKMDVSQVNPKIWDNIEKQMFDVAPIKNYKYLKVISAIAAIFILGVVLFKPQFGNSTTEIPTELLVHYGFENQNIEEALSNKITIVGKTEFPALYKDNFQQLYNQVKFLDEAYRSKVDYFQNKEYDENITKEVLGYYKTKSEILDKIIKEVKKINTNKRIYNIKNYEKSRIII